MEVTAVIKEFSYNWKIQVKDLFSDQDVKSPPFSRGDDNTGNYCLEIVGCQDASGDLCVRLGIRLLAGSSPVNGRVRFSIEGSEFQGTDVNHDFEPLEPGELASVMYALPLLVITKWANGKIEDQNLTVSCHLWLLLPSVTYAMSNNLTVADKQVRARLEREDIWSRRVWGCDVIIRCRHSAIQQTGEKNLDRVTWTNQQEGDSELESNARGVERALREDETPGKLFVAYGSESDIEHVRPRRGDNKSWPGVKRQSSTASRLGGKHGEMSRLRRGGINAIRARMLSGEGESIGFGQVRGNYEDSDYASTLDESEANSDEETDSEAVTRGWIIDTSGTLVDSYQKREKAPYPAEEKRFGDYFNRRSTSTTSTVRGASANSANHFPRDGNFAEFHVHRDVLRFRSPVFRQMLKDHRMNIIEVSDIDAEVMEELLRFIYTGSASPESLNTMAEQLLYSASKYEMLHLKGQCEDVLSAALNTENALRILLLADSTRAAILKGNTCVYAQKEYRAIFSTPYFVKFQMEHPKLSNELMTTIFTRTLPPTAFVSAK